MAARGLANLWRRIRRHPVRPVNGAAGPVIGESVTPLWTAEDTGELRLTAGKVENLRVAAQSLDGIEVPAGAVFSFWAQLGPPWKLRGFVEGRELREGCLIPSIGGGLCQLSNAIYDAALKAGFQTLERHAHTQVIPGSLAEQGRDATVFWNYVDLRLRSDRAFRLEVRMDAEHLTVRLRGERPDPALGAKPRPDLRKGPSLEAMGACDSCGVASCERSLDREAPKQASATWLLDGVWPEFNAWMREQLSPEDRVLLPLEGRPAYAWETGRARVESFPLLGLRRGLASRRLAAQGAARQRALLDWDARIAAAYARRIPAECRRLVVAQNLLPLLWRTGALGGRSFDVLLTRYPLDLLQAQLDEARNLHPESATLGDFRLDPGWVELEAEALAAATRIVTPHAFLARRFEGRAVQLPWSDAKPSARGSQLFFPASTLGRKGAYELREALRGLQLPLLLGGPVLESPDFWKGFDARPGRLAEARALLLPAFVEHQPRQLLVALAAGLPVIATEACGLPPSPGLRLVPQGDAAALKEAIAALDE